MYYEAMAAELLKIRSELRLVPASQQLSRMVTGEPFVLNYLAMQEGGVTPKQISVEMNVSTARIATLLNQLEEKGLVLRSDDPADNRRTIVRLTERGMEHIEEKRKGVLHYTAEMLETLGPDDACEYVRLQKKIAENYLGKQG